MALIAQAATLEARVPFLHFFDGFRTSHEVAKIEQLTDDDIRAMIDDELVIAHRARGLSPDTPFIRGTAQNPDVFFQARETVNIFYDRTPDIVQRGHGQVRQADRTAIPPVRLRRRTRCRARDRHDGFGRRDGPRDGGAPDRAGREGRPGQGAPVPPIRRRSLHGLAARDRVQGSPCSTAPRSPAAHGEPLYLDCITAMAGRRAQRPERSSADATASQPRNSPPAWSRASSTS